MVKSFVVKSFETNAVQWIPCDRVLPYPMTNVLVTTSDDMVAVGWVNSCGTWHTMKDFGETELATVVAWAPLPSPYAGAREHNQADRTNVTCDWR